MKILDRFVNDFIAVFQYFKERNKSKYCGDRFEEWVVKNSNIIKNRPTDSCNERIFWRLLDWRGDKFIDGYSALSSSAPDLLMECITMTSRIYEVGDVIAVECKWRNDVNFYLKKEDIEKYERFMSSNNLSRPIKKLFYVFGFGWSGDNPDSVYIVPAKELYNYNKETHLIRFPYKENSEEKAKRLERYRNTTEYLLYRN
ncbi:MAG: hypothetical protein LUE99_06110 [Bacteroides sp.]|nr:hypothetical protein [Bacteroides sp.]